MYFFFPSPTRQICSVLTNYWATNDSSLFFSLMIWGGAGKGAKRLIITVIIFQIPKIPYLKLLKASFQFFL